MTGIAITRTTGSEPGLWPNPWERSGPRFRLARQSGLKRGAEPGSLIDGARFLAVVKLRNFLGFEYVAYFFCAFAKLLLKPADKLVVFSFSIFQIVVS